ncbi:lysozyme inhibitor LprI family protein [Vibrio cincinnatiensis]
MKYLTLFTLLPFFSYAAEDISVDYDEIHKPYFNVSCMNEKNQEKMDICGDKSLLEATNAMVLLVDSLIESNLEPFPELSTKIKQSQAYWEQYHKINCEIETYESLGGSGYHSIFNACIEMKVNERISYLKWLESNI